MAQVSVLNDHARLLIHNQCTEMVTFTIKNNVTGLIYTNSVVVDDPLTQTLPTSSGTASQLIFMSQPSAATYNSVFVNQPSSRSKTRATMW